MSELGSGPVLLIEFVTKLMSFFCTFQAHKSAETMLWIAVEGWPLLYHAPYSPDLAVRMLCWFVAIDAAILVLGQHNYLIFIITNSLATSGPSPSSRGGSPARSLTQMKR